jgi:hypothetical protein
LLATSGDTNLAIDKAGGGGGRNGLRIQHAAATCPQRVTG